MRNYCRLGRNPLAVLSTINYFTTRIFAVQLAFFTPNRNWRKQCVLIP
ncbi:MAG: hypothetical protein LBE12_15210 [Planctomycetaceae bacterium]|nr:hypothetical protein [Planctomycetaceae bacterium]